MRRRQAQERVLRLLLSRPPGSDRGAAALAVRQGGAEALIAGAGSTRFVVCETRREVPGRRSRGLELVGSLLGPSVCLLVGQWVGHVADEIVSSSSSGSLRYTSDTTAGHPGERRPRANGRPRRRRRGSRGRPTRTCLADGQRIAPSSQTSFRRPSPISTEDHTGRVAVITGASSGIVEDRPRARSHRTPARSPRPPRGPDPGARHRARQRRDRDHSRRH